MNWRQMFSFPRGYTRYFQISSLVLLATLVFGIIFGAVYVSYLDFYALEQVETGLNYFVQVTDEGGNISRAKIASHSLNTNGLFILVAGVGGLLALIGLPLIWGLVFLRGALLGFTVGYLFHHLAWRGLVFCLVTIIPFSFVLLPGILFSGAQAMSFGILVTKRVFGGVDRNSPPPPILGYVLSQFMVFALLFIIALAEAATLPWLFQRMLPWALG